MYFHNWLVRASKKHGSQYVHRKEVLRYLWNKHDIKASVIRKEVTESDAVWIPIAVWDDEWYNFKG